MQSVLRWSCITRRFYVTLSLILLPFSTAFSSSLASTWVHSPHWPTLGDVLEEDFILGAQESSPHERSLSLPMEISPSRLLCLPPSQDEITGGWLDDIQAGDPGMFWYPLEFFLEFSKHFGLNLL